jgi:hypothetical protein
MQCSVYALSWEVSSRDVPRRRHCRDPGAVLKELDVGRDVMVHAHSWAGIPVCSALEGFSRAERQKDGKDGAVVKLTFVSSFVLQEGVSLQDFVGGYKDSCIKYKVSPTSHRWYPSFTPINLS